MAASVDETPVDRKLDDIFEEAYNLYTGFDDCIDPTNGLDFQVCNNINCQSIENQWRTTIITKLICFSL